MKPKYLLITIIFLSICSCKFKVKDDGRKLGKYYREDQRSIQIDELIDTLVQGYGLSDYAVLSEAPQIVWKDSTTTGVAREFGPKIIKNGELYIKAGDNFSHFVLNKRKEPVIWKIDLLGGRSGYSMVVLSNSVYSETFDGFSAYFKSKHILEKDTLMMCNTGYYGCRLRKIKLKIKKRDIWLIEQHSGGGNSGQNITIYFNSQGTDDIWLPKNQY